MTLTFKRRSKYNCPECDKALWHAHQDDGQLLLWCGNALCECDQACEGTLGWTEDQAYERLEKLWDELPPRRYVDNRTDKQKYDDHRADLELDEQGRWL